MITRAEFISTAVECGYASREKAERYAADLRAADREINADPDKYKTLKQPKTKPTKPKQTDATPTVTAYCKGCKYYFAESHTDYKMCRYMLLTGTSRPCPPGDGCTVRKRMGRGKAKGDRKC